MLKDGKYGLLNILGEIILPFEYDSISAEGFSPRSAKTKVMKEGKWGIRDLTNNLFLETEFLSISIQQNDKYEYYAIAENQNKKLAIINVETFLPITEHKYQNLEIIELKISNKDEPYFLAMKENKLGIIDLIESEVIPIQYDDILNLRIDKPDVLALRKADKVGLVNLENEVILEFNYDNMMYLNQNLIAIEQNRKVGLAQLDGKIIKVPEFDYISYFPSHTKSSTFNTRVEKDGKHGKINNLGDIVEPINAEIEGRYKNLELLIQDFFELLKSDNDMELEKFLRKVTFDAQSSYLFENQSYQLHGYPSKFKSGLFTQEKNIETLTKSFRRLKQKLEKKNITNNLSYEITLPLLEKELVGQKTLKKINNPKITVTSEDLKTDIGLGLLMKIDGVWKIMGHHFTTHPSRPK